MFTGHTAGLTVAKIEIARNLKMKGLDMHIDL